MPSQLPPNDVPSFQSILSSLSNGSEELPRPNKLRFLCTVLSTFAPCESKEEGGEEESGIGDQIPGETVAGPFLEGPTLTEGRKELSSCLG